MELLDYTPESVDIHLDRQELFTLLALVEEGRLTLNRKEPTSQAIDELLRTAAAMMDPPDLQAAGGRRAHSLKN